MPGAERNAVFSFLKETKGAVNWSIREMADTLRITQTEVKQILPVLEVQDYIQKVQDRKTGERDHWLTMESGESVAGAKFPRFKKEIVENALKKFADAIASINRDSESTFRVTRAVAFGDFLSGRPQVQAADVGIQIDRRNRDSGSVKEERAFLRSLRPKSALIHLRPFESWMEKRTHRTLNV